MVPVMELAVGKHLCSFRVIPIGMPLELEQRTCACIVPGL